MPIPQTLDKIKQSSLKQEVYTTLQEWIITGVLEPNEIVRDQELAVALGVSRTPVREALQRLEDQGLVRTAPGQWTRVVPIDIADATRIYPIIWSLEGLAIHLGQSSFQPEHFSRLQAANEHLKQALIKRDPVSSTLADTEFHAILLQPANNSELVGIVKALKTKVRRLDNHYFKATDVTDDSINEHQLIIEALQAGDVQRAVEAVQQNWQASMQRLLERVSQGQ